MTEESIYEQSQVSLGLLPPRYAEDWFAPFQRAIEPALAPDVRILDVGSGRRPTLPPWQRPANCHYAGLDVARAELDAAPAGSYNEIIVGDITASQAVLMERFDLIVSWQVLEHVKPLDVALANLRSYLVPGGLMVAQLSGAFAAFALAARVVPFRLSRAAMVLLLDVDAEEKFPTHYDRCWYAALDRMLAQWSEHSILPRYKGGRYFRFARPAERAYLAYENQIAQRDWRNLATHYVISARR